MLAAATGKRLTTYTIAAEVYRAPCKTRGRRPVINEAQHVATKRALANLRRKGVVAAHRDSGRHAGWQEN